MGISHHTPSVVGRTSEGSVPVLINQWAALTAVSHQQRDGIYDTATTPPTACHSLGGAPAMPLSRTTRRACASAFQPQWRV